MFLFSLFLKGSFIICFLQGKGFRENASKKHFGYIGLRRGVEMGPEGFVMILNVNFLHPQIKCK